MNKFCFLIFTFLAVNASATSVKAECVEKYERLGRFALHTLPSQNECMLSVSDEKSPGRGQLRYRSYIFTDQGLFMIFVSNGNGPASTDTGSRTYYLFPRAQLPTYYRSANGDVHVVTNAENEFIFSNNTGDIYSATGLDVTVDPDVNMQNRGGIEISNSSILYLDSGWKVGGMAPEDFERYSTFHRPGATDCTFKNGKIFEFHHNDDVALKLRTDAELADFLFENCP